MLRPLYHSFSCRQRRVAERPSRRRRPVVGHHPEAVHLEPGPLRFAPTTDRRTHAEQIRIVRNALKS